MMEKRGIVTERTVIVETLKTYRQLHYLWNPTHKLYSNKNARRRGLEILLKSWRKLEPKATLACVKKKLNNWRAAYRRERNKIINSMRTAEEPDEIHKPSLWYYDHLTFLNDECPVLGKDCDDTLEIDTTNDIHDNTEAIVEELEEETNEEIEDVNDVQEEVDSDEEPLKKTSTSTKRRSQGQSLKQKSLIMESPQLLIQSNVLNEENSQDLFGRAIGSQLKELSKFQRCVAEKLISEIMFYGKLEQLTIGTSIHLDSTAP